LKRIPPKKLCPFLKDDVHFALECLENQCACYVRMEKPSFLTANVVNPEAYYKYEGCGLVNAIPWELVERKPEAKTPEQKVSK
jgi:hypothetical protein